MGTGTGADVVCVVCVLLCVVVMCVVAVPDAVAVADAAGARARGHGHGRGLRHGHGHGPQIATRVRASNASFFFSASQMSQSSLDQVLAARPAHWYMPNHCVPNVAPGSQSPTM